MSYAYALFDTALGSAGLAWSDQGILGIELPQPDRAHARYRLRRRFPGALEQTPPPEIQQAIDRIVALLAGQPADLSPVELDLRDVPDFDRQVYAVARTVRAGETVSYGDIARRLGDVHLARDVGQALGRNPYPIVVPCHRVISADGRLGGFSARGGVNTKQQLLSIERANVSWQLALL